MISTAFTKLSNPASCKYLGVFKTHYLLLSFQNDAGLLKRLIGTSLVCFDKANIVRSPFPNVEVPNVSFPNFIWDDNDKCSLVNSDLIKVVCISSILFL